MVVEVEVVVAVEAVLVEDEVVAVAVEVTVVVVVVAVVVTVVVVLVVNVERTAVVVDDVFGSVMELAAEVDVASGDVELEAWEDEALVVGGAAPFDRAE